MRDVKGGGARLAFSAGRGYIESVRGCRGVGCAAIVLRANFSDLKGRFCCQVFGSNCLGLIVS